MKLSIYVNGVETDITLNSAQIKAVKNYNVPIMERITSVEAALEYNGKSLERFAWETERDTDQQKADKELEEVCRALREGKELRMEDAWFYPRMLRPDAGSGSGFSYAGYFYDRDGSGVGARHCVDTSDKAIYLGKQFSALLTRVLSPRPAENQTNTANN